MTDDQSFKSFVKQLLLPSTILLYVLTLLLQLKESLEKLGLQIFSAGLFIILLLWTIYVWVARPPATAMSTASGKFIYNKKVRYGAIAALLLSIAPLLYIIQIHRLPTIAIQVNNERNVDVNFGYFNNYNIMRIATNGLEYAESSGVIRVSPTTAGDGSLLVRAKSTSVFRGEFLNEQLIRHYLSEGDCFIQVYMKAKDGGLAQGNKMLLLTRGALQIGIVELVIQ